MRSPRRCVARCHFSRYRRRLLWDLRDRIEGPFQLARDDVESTHFATGLINRPVVGDTRSEDDGVAYDGGRRSFLVVAEEVRGEAQPVAQIDDAVVAEIGA